MIRGTLTLSTADERKFWRKVKKGPDCWEWDTPGARYWYGGLRLESGVTVKAHRASWVIHKGVIPGGLCVLHECDNQACVRPDHLFLGTKYDNANDCHQKGRGARLTGELHGRAKLTEASVREIRRVGSTRSVSSLAREHGVSRTLIRMVIQRRIWKHVH